MDRQLRPIYGTLRRHDLNLLDSYSYSILSIICFGLEALDTGSNKSAILACNKLLKKQPKNDLVKVRTSLS